VAADGSGDSRLRPPSRRTSLRVLSVARIVVPVGATADRAYSANQAWRDVENLALACIDCNLRKGPNLSGIDPESDAIVPLFHPRLQSWEEHFRLEGARIVGVSSSGRATVAVMEFNMQDRVQVRLAMVRSLDD
jgi:hypothetical protein